MQGGSQYIYKTHTGEVIEITQIEARILNNKNDWRIPFDSNWEKLLYKIKESNILILQILNPQPLEMFKCISSIYFGSLIQLNLSQIGLTTTQLIITLNTPNIEYIRLSQNFLTNIKALRKINFPKLKQLRLYSNLIVDCSPLVELHSKQNLVIMISDIHKRPMMRNVIHLTNPIQDYSPFLKLKLNLRMYTKPFIRCLNKQKIGPILMNRYLN